MRNGVVRRASGWAAALLGVLLTCSAMAEGGGADAAKPARLLASQSRLAAALIGVLSQRNPAENLILSPASVAGLLSIIDLGGDATMHDRIAETLQLDRTITATDDIRAAQDLASKDGDLTSANRMVFDTSVPLASDALHRLSGAGVDASADDFRNKDLVDRINDWASRATHGKIADVLDQIPGDAKVLALNALYFKRRWSIPFRADGTRPGDFETAAGVRLRTQFMHGPGWVHPTREDARFVAVDLSFAGDRFSMVILTTKDKPALAAEFLGHLGWLTGQGFERSPDQVIVTMPLFAVRSRNDLTDALAGLGLDGNMTLPAFTSQPLPSPRILQTVDMTIDEEGAEVAAVTGGFFPRGKMDFPRSTDIVIDKPFAFALRDRATGLIVVVGYIAAVDGRPVAYYEPTLSAKP